MAEDPSKNEIEELRKRFVDAPTLEGKRPKGKKVIRVYRSPWILRSIIIAVGIILVVEGIMGLQLRKELLRVIVSNPPPAVSYPAPEVSSQIAPPIATADAEDYLPEPTPIPLPSELEGIEFPDAGDQ